MPMIADAHGSSKCESMAQAPAVSSGLRLMRALLITVALLSFTGVADARCRQMGVAPELLNPDRALASDAALVVRLISTPSVRPGSNTFPAMSLTRGSDTIALRIEPLSASLARYVPASRPAAGRWRVEGLGRDVTFGTTRAPALAAPRVTSVRSVSSARGRRGSNYSVTGVLAAAAPAHAIAVFGKHASSTFGDGAQVGGQTNVTVFSWRTRCRRWPDGMGTPPTSGAVQLRFVGEDGQLSPLSNSTNIS